MDDGLGKGQLQPDVTNSKPHESPILIQIAAFRDHRCGRTLHDGFKKAINPDRIFFSVVDQIKEGEDQGCLEQYCALAQQDRPDDPCPYTDQINIITVPAESSRGPVVARARQLDALSEHWKHLHAESTSGTDGGFCLQIDAHSMFDPEWDRRAIAIWMSAKNEFAVLATYIPNLDQMGNPFVAAGMNRKTVNVPHMYRTLLGTGGVPRNTRAASMENMPRAVLGSLWAAGMSFSKCHAEAIVPNDPYMRGIFDGEEYSKGARLFTHGYDMYTPHRNYVYHDYGHTKSKSLSWQQNDLRSHKKPKVSSAEDLIEGSVSYRIRESESIMDHETAVRRIKMLLRYHEERNTKREDEPWTIHLDEYDLGPVRTIQQYAKFGGVDFYLKPKMCDWVGHDRTFSAGTVPGEERKKYVLNIAQAKCALHTECNAVTCDRGCGVQDGVCCSLRRSHDLQSSPNGEKSYNCKRDFHHTNTDLVPNYGSCEQRDWVPYDGKATYDKWMKRIKVKFGLHDKVSPADKPAVEADWKAPPPWDGGHPRERRSGRPPPQARGSGGDGIVAIATNDVAVMAAIAVSLVILIAIVAYLARDSVATLFPGLVEPTSWREKQV